MDGLKKTIDQSYLTEKSKVWCYQHTLYHRVMWPLKGNEITTSAAIRMDAKVNNFIWKWLGLSQHSTLLGTNALPLKSINLGYKHEKTGLVFQLRDSPDPTIRNTRAQPADAAEAGSWEPCSQAGPALAGFPQSRGGPKPMLRRDKTWSSPRW